VFNLIYQGTSPIFQVQIGLHPAVPMVEIGAECRKMLIDVKLCKIVLMVVNRSYTVVNARPRIPGVLRMPWGQEAVKFVL